MIDQDFVSRFPEASEKSSKIAAISLIENRIEGQFTGMDMKRFQPRSLS